jgi:hypothetical protein
VVRKAGLERFYTTKSNNGFEKLLKREDTFLLEFVMAANCFGISY